MGIKKTVTITCDCCGADVTGCGGRGGNQEVTISGVDSNYGDPWDETYVYCKDCTKYLWKAIRAIPKIRELEKEGADG